MTGFSGRIMLEGHLDTAKSHLGTAMKLADKLSVWKKTQGISSVTKAYDLGDGSYCVIVDLAHMRAMQIVAPTASQAEYESFEQVLTQQEYTGVADVISGKVPSWDDARIVTEQVQVQGSDGEPVTTNINVLKAFEPTQRTAQRYSDLERRYRLNLEESPIFAPLTPQLNVVYSQHAHVKPSCYTGAMRKLVQFILGMGRITRPTWEERWMKANKRGALPVKQKSIESNTTSETLSAFNLYYRKDVVEVLNTYDYRFGKTHGVSFDPDGVPYLIEISTRGVYAMPLYMDPVSTTIQGRARYLSVSPELQYVFDTFNGIPLGTNFPFVSSDNLFDKWKRAGEIIELMPGGLTDFYSKSAYSSNMGWVLNSRGTEAHNTCYGYTNTSIKVGYHYRLKINIQKADELPALEGYKAQLASRFIEAYKINKCRRMSDVDARILLLKYERSESEGNTAFDELVVSSNMKGSAAVNIVNFGYLYYPWAINPDIQPDIKFPEPLADGLISIDFRPESSAAGAAATGIRCDTPIFVCMIGDSVEIVNYFYDPRPAVRESINTRGACQYTGSWQTSSSSSDPQIQGNFYSNRWDFRTEMAASWSTTLYTSRKVNTYGVASSLSFFGMCIFVFSRVMFFVNWSTTGYTGGSLVVAVSIPFNDRNCYYMLREENYGSTFSSFGGYPQDVMASHRQLWELYNFAFHWKDTCTTFDFSPPVRETNYVCVARKLRDWHDDSACVHAPLPVDISYSVCPENVFANTSIVVRAPLWNDGILGSANFSYKSPPATFSVTNPTVSKSKYEIYMINDSGFGPIITKQQEITNQQYSNLDGSADWRSNWWWRFSPDKFDASTPWMGVSQSCLGATIVNYSKDMLSDSASLGAPASMFGSPHTCYTGVIE